MDVLSVGASQSSFNPGQNNSINSENVNTVLRGASILGSGGGGSYTEAVENYRSHDPDPVEVRDLEDFSEEATIVTVFGLGPVDHNTEDPLEIAQESAARYESEYGQIDGIILGELGPDLIVEAVGIADRLEVPVVNADVAGMRAVPSIQNEIIEETGISRTPLVATNGDETAYIESGTGQEIEEEVRELTDNNIWYITGYANTADEYSNSVPTGWLEECMSFEEANIERIGVGALESAEREQVDGHTVGRILIQGQKTLEIYFQNENLLVYRGEEEVARAPETISIIDSDGIGVTNGNLPEEGEQLEVYRISYEFWEDNDCFSLRNGNFPSSRQEFLRLLIDSEASYEAGYFE